MANIETANGNHKSGFEKLKEMIFAEYDLSYATNQNILLSCDRDGCTRINNCTCDCNDGC